MVDLDAMGHRLHGMQEGRHYRAYYDEYCYLPLYVFVGDFPLVGAIAHRRQGRGRRSGGGAGKDRGRDSKSLPPGADHRARGQRLLPGGDHGLVREPAKFIIVLGLAKNSVLVERLGPALANVANPLVSERGGQRAGVRASLHTTPSRVGAGRAG